MLPDVSTSTKPRPGNFASVLAGLAAKRGGDGDRLEPDELADDVVTLTYEQALRGRGRYRYNAPEAEAGEERTMAAPDADAGPAAELEQPCEPAESRGEAESTRAARKAASITVRMSGTECVQVHARAEEAGMTVSAYMRSCVFEAESLRAQVKQALAEMRAGAENQVGGDRERARVEHRDAARGWKRRFLPRWAQGKSDQA